MKKEKQKEVIRYHDFNIDDRVIAITEDKRAVEGYVHGIHIKKSEYTGLIKVSYDIVYEKTMDEFSEKDTFRDKEDLIARIGKEELLEMLKGKIERSEG